MVFGLMLDLVGLVRTRIRSLPPLDPPATFPSSPRAPIGGAADVALLAVWDFEQGF